MSRDLLDLVRELNTLNDDDLADRVIENSDVQWCLSELQDILEEMPTLTQPNEPLTLISMNDELPPDKERVLVYRPCMADSDIGPYSVQWGWAAKRDGSHWAHLPNRRPDEKDETL